MGVYSFDWAEPAEQIAISTPLKAPGSILWTRTGSPRNVTVLPTERPDAQARSSHPGTFRSPSHLGLGHPAPLERRAPPTDQRDPALSGPPRPAGPGRPPPPA